MKRILLLIFVLAASPADAACHKYSVWHYPWRQRCFTALAPPAFHVKQAQSSPQERIEIPLPKLEFTPAPDVADERLIGIAKMRALRQGW